MARKARARVRMVILTLGRFDLDARPLVTVRRPAALDDVRRTYARFQRLKASEVVKGARAFDCGCET
jgi:hypothetical protein